MGHEVICLPPYHCQYNLIGLIWAISSIKGEVTKNNTTFKFDNAEKLLNDALDSITVENLKKCTNHCYNLQEDFIKGLRDEILILIILTINLDDSSDSESDNEESYF